MLGLVWYQFAVSFTLASVPAWAGLNVQNCAMAADWPIAAFDCFRFVDSGNCPGGALGLCGRPGLSLPYDLRFYLPASKDKLV